MITIVPFKDLQLAIVRHEQRAYVEMWPICRALGLGMEAETERLQRFPWCRGALLVPSSLPAHGLAGVFIQTSHLGMWLVTVSRYVVGAGRSYAEQEVMRGRLLGYQKAAATSVEEWTLKRIGTSQGTTP